MIPRMALGVLAIFILAVAPAAAVAEQMTFRVLPSPSRATFKTDAPLETVIGITAGPAISGTVTGDLTRPQTATGTIRVDLTTLKTGIDKRDADMRSRDFLDTDFTNHGMQVPQVLFMKLSDEIQLEVDLTLARQ